MKSLIRDDSALQVARGEQSSIMQCTHRDSKSYIHLGNRVIRNLCNKCIAKLSAKPWRCPHHPNIDAERLEKDHEADGYMFIMIDWRCPKCHWWQSEHDRNYDPTQFEKWGNAIIAVIVAVSALVILSQVW